jgi:membrane-associated phospholipid phosphatase
MRRHLVLKLVGTSLIIGVFFVAYLHLLHHPSYPVTMMPSTALDRFLPFQPQWLFLYLSLWLYVGVGPGLQLRFVDLVNYTAWAAMLCVVGLAIFYFWPTQVPPPGLDVSPYFGFAMLQAADAAGNACPSMHVAFSTFTLIRIDNVLRLTGAPKFMRAANVVWFLAIVFSTLAIKQHVILDVFAGLVLGTVFAVASLRWGFAIPKPHPTAMRA